MLFVTSNISRMFYPPPSHSSLNQTLPLKLREEGWGDVYISEGSGLADFLIPALLLVKSLVNPSSHWPMKGKAGRKGGRILRRGVCAFCWNGVEFSGRKVV